MPKDSLFPDDEPRGFQVWHKHGTHYEHVATVESNALGAIMMTTHGSMDHERWQDNPRVSPMPGEHRSTTIGDVLIGRDGQSLEISADKELGLHLKPIPAIDQSQHPQAKATGKTPDYLPTGRDRHIRRVLSRIEELQGATYHCHPENGAFPLDGEPDGDHRNMVGSSIGWDTWSGLSGAEQRDVLNHHVDWQGFAHHHIKDVISKVIREEPKERWMDAIRQPSAAADSAHRAQFQERDDAKGLDR